VGSQSASPSIGLYGTNVGEEGSAHDAVFGSVHRKRDAERELSKIVAPLGDASQQCSPVTALSQTAGQMDSESHQPLCAVAGAERTRGRT
jgi:hypothetical protein